MKALFINNKIRINITFSAKLKCQNTKWVIPIQNLQPLFLIPQSINFFEYSVFPPASKDNVDNTRNSLWNLSQRLPPIYCLHTAQRRTGGIYQTRKIYSHEGNFAISLHYLRFTGVTPSSVHGYIHKKITLFFIQKKKKDRKKTEGRRKWENKRKMLTNVNYEKWVKF